MKPILYRFSINGHSVKPTYKNDLAKEYELESSQQFFRAKLSGKLSFIKEDFDWLDEQDFETEFILLLEESFDGGKTWKEYYKGKFMKTDCTWDNDNRKCEVQPDTYDQYNEVLAGLDKEFNLIEIAPEIKSVIIKKRPMIQIYISGDKVLSNFIGGSYWEQEVTEEVTDEETLINTYYFSKAATKYTVKITGGNSKYLGNYEGTNIKGTLIQIGGTNKLVYFEERKQGSQTSIIYENGYTTSDNAFEFRQSIERGYSEPGTFLDIPTEFTLKSTTEELKANRSDVYIYMRYLTDSLKIRDLNTYELPDNDIVTNNRNYKRAIGFNFNLFYTSAVTQKEPTQWGRSSNGEYFVQPGANYFPIARNSWDSVSYWFYNDRFYTEVFEEDGTKEILLKDAYTVSSCINVLLQNIVTGVKHESTQEYSQFLYANSNPITGQQFTLLVTPKSNVLVGEYQTPALKAITTLREFLNMLRDCYRCYWYIEDGKFKIEHIKFFRNGGNYESPQIGIDLTKIESPNNGKKWGYLTNNYEFDKSDMPERYQFSWMDEVTDAFDGQPIQINSKYVTDGKIEEITIQNFTTDVDYMLLNPSAISQDGFALFSATLSGSNYVLPIIEREINGNALRIQNGYASWITLQPNYYIYDLPASKATINGRNYTGLSTSRNKKQKVKFPTLQDIETNKLIKTYIGDGQIEKISVNLSSRINEVTLKYDTEQ